MLNRCCAFALLLCAWVLWEEVQGYNVGRGNFTLWFLRAADETKAACGDALSAAMKRAQARPVAAGFKRSVGDTSISDSAENGSVTRFYQFWCLPAGTDPRPRYPPKE